MKKKTIALIAAGSVLLLGGSIFGVVAFNNHQLVKAEEARLEEKARIQEILEDTKRKGDEEEARQAAEEAARLAAEEAAMENEKNAGSRTNNGGIINELNNIPPRFPIDSVTYQTWYGLTFVSYPANPNHHLIGQTFWFKEEWKRDSQRFSYEKNGWVVETSEKVEEVHQAIMIVN